MQKNITFWPFSGRQFCLSLLVLFIVGFFYSSAWSQSVSTYTSSGTFVVPTGVTSVTVECYGGGGGGGGTAVNPSKGGGGSGGAYARSVVTVTPGATYTVTVGSGGIKGTNTGGAGGAGGASSFFGESNNVNAPGGTGGAAGTSAVPIGLGAPAPVNGAIGTFVFYGGNGGDAGSGNSGGGGSSAGSASNGVNASANTGGTAVAGGGSGANGRITGGNGATGAAPGGGGAGGFRSSGTTRTGGAGGSGEVILTYTCPSVSLPVAQGFNGATDPSCWSDTILNYGTNATPAVTYDTTATITDADFNDQAVAPEEGTAMLIFNSFDCDQGSELRLVMQPVSTMGMSNLNVNFYMGSDNGYSDAADYVQVQYSLDQGVTWVDAGSPFYRYDSTSITFQWNAKSVSLPNAVNNVANLLMSFKFHSEFGNNIYLDNLSINGTSSPLSLDLISFNGTTSGVVNKLNWATAEEKDFDSFELERSSDGISFVKIATINANKNSAGSNYAYVDRNPFQGKNIYRLKMVNNNSSFKYSQNVSLTNVVPSGLSINVYPNPVKQQLNVVINGKSDGPATILISDLLGNLVRSIQLNEATVQIDFKQFPAGTYFVKYADSGTTIVKKIIKD